MNTSFAVTAGANNLFFRRAATKLQSFVALTLSRRRKELPLLCRARFALNALNVLKEISLLQRTSILRDELEELNGQPVCTTTLVFDTCCSRAHIRTQLHKRHSTNTTVQTQP